MSTGWIEGRFEGLYSGLKRPSVDSRAKRAKVRRPHASSSARRFGFVIESGRVHDLSLCNEPDPESVEDDRVIRQDRLKRVRLSEAEAGDAYCETSLFDVYITDWQLKYPAEESGRAYGTIIGTIRARRRPSLDNPPAAEVSTPPPGEARLREDRANTALIPGPVRNETTETDDPAIVTTSLGWAEVALLVAIVFTAIGYACGMRHALFWLAPIATTLGLLWLKPDGIVRGVPPWMMSMPTALQLLIVASPLTVAWKADCWPVLGSVQLALLSVPLLLSVIVGSRGSLWITCAVWSAICCSHCAGGDADSCIPITASEPRAVSEMHPSYHPGQRTDARGRWPVMPPSSTPAVVPESEPASGTPRGAAPGGEVAPGAPSATAPLETASATMQAGPSASTHMPDSAAPTPEAPVSPAQGDTPSGNHRLTQVDGGWLSPDHRRAHREQVLISIEQANRTPALFFESDGAHRVYLPTDPIFEDGSSVLRPEAPIVLARIAALLNLPSRPHVLLEVHSDSAGAPENQIALSRRRADNVRSWLVERGHISASRFEMLAIGGARPLVPPDGNYGAQQPNRRIEIRIVN